MKNTNPCIKPLQINEYIAQLIKPATNNGRLLVGYSGSGTEIIGGLKAGWDEVVGIEISPEFVDIAERRIKHWQKIENRNKAFDKFMKKNEQLIEKHANGDEEIWRKIFDSTVQPGRHINYKKARTLRKVLCFTIH